MLINFLRDKAGELKIYLSTNKVTIQCRLHMDDYIMVERFTGAIACP